MTSSPRSRRSRGRVQCALLARRRQAEADGPGRQDPARNLHLTDDVHDRLFLLARHRRQTVSAVANDLLDRALPRWELKRQG